MMHPAEIIRGTAVQTRSSEEGSGISYVIFRVLKSGDYESFRA